MSSRINSGGSGERAVAGKFLEWGTNYQAPLPFSFDVYINDLFCVAARSWIKIHVDIQCLGQIDHWLTK